MTEAPVTHVLLDCFGTLAAGPRPVRRAECCPGRGLPAQPHPARYAAALRRAGADPARTVFTGDTSDADYAGPAAAGMTAFLIDPAGRHDIPAGRRLRSLAALPARLRAAAGGP